MESIKVAGAALNQTPLDWATNLDNIKQAILEAKAAKVDLLCLPELCITGYGCEDWFLSPWVAEEALHQLTKILPLTYGITVSVRLPLRYRNILYNCSCLIRDQQILGFTAKQFLANDGVHYEPRWFTSWKAGQKDVIEVEGKNYPIGDVTYEVKGYKIGFEICEDAWREDQRPGWMHLKNNIDIILNPSASHFALAKADLRKALVSSSSKKFKCLYLYANLLGNEAGRMIYDGDIIFGWNGKIIKRNTLLSFKNVNLLTLEFSRDYKDFQEFSPPADPEVLSKEFTLAASLALFDYMRKSKSKGFVLSLSGGADSSACAVLVAHAVKLGLEELGITKFLEKLGRRDIEPLLRDTGDISEVRKDITKHILTCVYQGTKNSSHETYSSAESLAASLGASFYHWIIDEEVNSYTQKVEKALNRRLSWEADDITLQNIQARARSPIIWMIANIQNALLITTSNRSEGDVGYATMDGDTSGSIAPIAAIDKHFLLHWLKWTEEVLGYEGLKEVNALTPSAELRPSEKVQTDEKDLMPYYVIVEIERLAIREKKSPVGVYQELSAVNLEPKEVLKAHIVKFFTLWARNQWKRERIAPAFHLDDFNIDPRTWCRFPILSGSFTAELEILRQAP